MRPIKLLVAALLSLSVGALPVMAATTVYHDPSVGNGGDPLAVDFTTNRMGGITVTVTYNPKPTSGYSLHVTGPASCYAKEDSARFAPQTGTLTCTISEAPAGNYHVHFAGTSGKTSATMTVEAETD